MSQQRILYVEDDALVAFAVEMAIAEAGYDILTVSSGAAALVALQSGPPPDLLLTDIRLPGVVDGWAIAKRARELIPDLPVVYASGDSGGEWSEKGVPGSTMLQKPFTVASVLQMVRRALSRV